MSIERLNKAASAAGFAMAMPDDELVAEARTVEKVDAPEPSRAIVISGGADYRAAGRSPGSGDWVGQEPSPSHGLASTRLTGHYRR